MKIKIGKINKENGLYQKSLEYYLMAQKSLIGIGWDESELQLLENIGNIYLKFGSN